MAVALLSAQALAQSAPASLIHRYNFNETSGTTVNDSVGTADGVIKGNGAAFDGSGQLYLPGGASSADPADVLGGYVDLPNHIINVLTNATFESWVTWDGGGAWQRIFDFGTSAGGEDVVNGNGNYLFLSPAGNVNLRFAVRDPATGTEPVQLTAATPLDLAETCVTVTYDYSANTCRMFSNGVQVVTGPANVALSTINDVNNWLGRSQWADPMFQGSFNEFRIYNTALSPVEVAASYASGPNTPSTDPTALGTVQQLRLAVPKTSLFESDIQGFTASADFAKAQNVSLAGASGLTIQSDNPSVARINAAGQIEAVSAGSAKVTASYLGKTDEVSITVSRRQEGVAVAGTLYVDLRAADASSDINNWKNRVTTGDFTAEGTPTYVANVENTGVAGVRFNGTEAFVGPLSTRDLDQGSDRSIEVWAFNPAIASEETLVAWGHRGGPDLSNMSFNYGNNALYGAVGHWGQDVGWNGSPVAGQWHYLVYTYDGSTARVYADGVLKSSRTYAAPLDTYIDFPIRLGAQASNDGSVTEFGQSLTGYLAMVRVHGGVLSDNDIKNNFLYGVNLTPPGEIQGVTLKLDTPTLIGIGARGQATVLANYASGNYFYVSPQAAFQSSDTNIATVDANGLITARGAGTVTITGTYGGKQGTQSLQILGAPPAKLVHRYSFGEAPGSTTVRDSVGTANGTVKGNGADFDGNGQLLLNGGTGSAASDDTISGYVDLPNGIIRVLTNATFEAWVTWEGTGQWERIFDFGTSDGGEDVVNGNGNYLFLTPTSPTNPRFAVRDPATSTEPVQITSPATLATETEVYWAVSYDYLKNTSQLYSNAVVIGSSTASVALRTINDVNNWLGRSQWNDAMFQGKFNEFRIWDGALSAAQVAASHASGPNQLPEAPAEAPSILIRLSGGNLIIHWPSNATGFSLESTPNLGPTAAWTTVNMSSATDQGGQKSLTLPLQGVSQYYRLKK